MSELIIVESPTKAHTLSRFLGSNYKIEATMGHVRDLPEKELGIKIASQKKEGENSSYDFHPEYQLIMRRRDRVKEIRRLAAKSEKITLATDPDREGEAIAYHIYYLLSKNVKTHIPEDRFCRIVFHEITEGAIKRALSAPQKINMQLVDAQQARRVLDRLVGYKLSPLLWSKIGKRWLSAGRVQSVAVRLIVEREREIEAFKPQEYWVVEVELAKTDGSKKSFLARLASIDGKKWEWQSKEQTELAVSGLKNADFKVAKVEEKELRRYPSPPFTTSTLQQTAANRFGWSAKRTMKTAQTLYEEGYITYHRTDSTNLSQDAINMARDFVKNALGKPYLPDTPKFYKTKSKVAQEAHEAIRPTNIKVVGTHDLQRSISWSKDTASYGLKSIDVSLGRDADLLYSLVWRRFSACQINEAVFSHTDADIEAVGKISPDGQLVQYQLKTSGEKMKFDGWLVLYNKYQNTEESTDEEENEKELPPLTDGERLNLSQVLPQQKFTQPPARYNEASLIKLLEEKGIGRPSTYAPIISTIQDRKYVEKIEKRFHPTDLGKTVNDFLVKYFPDIFDIGFTARMEDELDNIANGQMQWQRIISGFYGPFIDKIDKVFKEAEKVKMDLGTTDQKCPKCGNPLVIRLSKYGRFYACSTFPACDYTNNILETVGIKCPRCGSEMIVRKTRRGKQFYGCSSYPKCTFAAWKKEDIK
ncbi:type I DNA topoisomerase [Patescibacteria group bacterium]|nr:type I DNA topoisomerase [Patescibacteria group bacterium]MCL5798385.1 type I DNA topoisomerase [Patescibacteria group bacterium]